MKQRLLACGFFLALSAAGACGSDDEPFSDGGAGQSGASGRGGSAGSAGEGGADSGGSLSEPEDIRTWANSVSSLGLYIHAYEPIAVADGEATLADPSCPVMTDDGETLELVGGCTSSDGVEWVGRATVVRSTNGDRTLTYDGFGTITDATEETRTGEARVLFVDAMEHDFVLDLVHEGPVTTTVDYAGNVVGDYGTRTVWSGSGTVTREGTTSPVGTVEATTTEEVVDDAVCSGQPASGSTVIESASDTVVITYDGSTNCDAENAASYSLNGVPQGTISGIICSFAPSRGRDPVALALFLLVGALLGARRKPGPGVTPAKR
jgi:hypothetical protein